MFASVDPRSFYRLPPDPRLGWVPYAWLAFLVGLYAEPFLGDGSAALWLLTIAATMAFLPLYFRSFWVRGQELVAVAVITAGIAAALSSVNFGASVLFVYAAAMLARQTTASRALAGVASITALAVLVAYLTQANDFYWITAAVTTPFIGGVSIHDTQVSLRDAKLRLAQSEVERLAAVAERERIARDLHDVLGHTLTLIVRKAELASRLADRDLPAARDEIRALESICRGALAEVREAVSGYRATWHDEVARAERLLASAALRGEFRGEPAFRSRAEEEVLALALREAITNVVRHARATTVTVDWTAAHGERQLSIRDDGIGVADAEGNGLRGIRERAESVGGLVSLRSRPEVSGTALAISLPESVR